MSYFKNGVQYDKTSQEVAQHYDVTADWIRTLAREHGLPHVRAARLYYFNMDAVERFFVEKRVRTGGLMKVDRCYPGNASITNGFKEQNPSYVDYRDIDVSGI